MKKKIRNYIALFEEEEDGGYSVWVPSLPGCASQGDTLEEAISNIHEAIELYLEDHRKDEEGLSEINQIAIPIRMYA